MLTERQNKILKLIVEKYIKEPIPVGSKVISKLINCSSATVRNEMGELEKFAKLLIHTAVWGISGCIARWLPICKDTLFTLNIQDK
mgnify:CR=1 FL=1